MVFGHNLHLMAPFEFLAAGFCMVFRRASFLFLGPGADVGVPGRILGPGWARGLLVTKNWLEKHGCVWKLFSEEVSRGS